MTNKVNGEINFHHGISKQDFLYAIFEQSLQGFFMFSAYPI